MKLSDFTKDVRRFLLEHWTLSEIESRLEDPEYFFDHVVAERIRFLKSQGEDVPRLRLQKTPSGAYSVILNQQ